MMATTIPAVTGAAFNDGRVTLSGMSDAGSDIAVYEGTHLIGTATAGSDGLWALTGLADASAYHSYGVVAFDAAGTATESTHDYTPTSTAGAQPGPIPSDPPASPPPTQEPTVPPVQQPPATGSGGTTGNGTTPLENATHVVAGDSVATIQSKLNALPSGGTLVFEGNTTFDFQGTTLVGKSGVTILADGPVDIVNAPGAGTRGAMDFSGQSGWTIRGRAPGEGFVFDRSLINATDAKDWAVGNCIFNGQAANGYDGAAIRMNGASFGTVINNDFNNAQGNVLGMYDLDNITIDGNHFTDCWQPVSIQEPTNADHSLGRNIAITNNVFLGTQRAAIEVGPSSTGAEYFSNLTVTGNYFDDFDNRGGAGTLLPISLVGQAAENTTVTGNYIYRGPNDAGDIGVAIEMTGTGEVSNNTIENFAYAALTYQSGWNVHDNAVYNDGSSPYFGFANNGSGSGSFGAVSALTDPLAPALPIRLDW
jgi:hypothetical protein